MSQKPLVSVITIFFNGERFIREAVESVFAQTYDNWELFLVDDGSTDTSTEIARQYAAQYPTKVYYLQHEGHQNRGMSATRNLGQRHARGCYVGFLDSDDVWLPHKLERQVAILESQPQAAMIYGATHYWYSWTGLPEDLNRDYTPDLGIESDTLFEPTVLLTRNYPLGTGTACCPSDFLIRRDTILRVGGFEESFSGKYQMYEDQAFLAKVNLKEAVFVSRECWDRYRIHSDSCVSVVSNAGEYNNVRLFFLKWLENYLCKEMVGEPRIWASLKNAIAKIEHPTCSTSPTESSPEFDRVKQLSQLHRWLRVGQGNRADLRSLADNPDAVKIAIKKATTRIGSDIQLNEPFLKVRANHRYVVNFLARADSPRSIFVGFAKAHEPWSNLGLYSQIELTSDWQSFEESFFATGDDDNARIHFDVGQRDISVDLSSVTLRSVSEGRFVTPSIASTQLDRPEPKMILSESPVPLGHVQFGSLRQVTPINSNWGWDRGLPIDRYYIERFLACYAEDIRGHVLEIGDNSYTCRFGGERVTISDVLHVADGNPHATIVADLTSADDIPSNTFECIILTQTLQLVYDVRSALRTVYRILKPGGVLLTTFPGISQTYDAEWGNHWYWSFTIHSAKRVFGELFPEPNVKIESFGNVFAAIAFLHGLAVEELTREELDRHESGYDLTIAVRAVKPAIV